MFNKKTKALLLITLLVFSLSVTANAGQQVQIKDYEGVQFTVELPAEKIVCLSASMNQILLALEVEDRIVGWDKNSKEDVFPKLEKEITVVGENSHKPQIEAIAQLNPDVVIASTMLQEDARKKIESFGIPVIVERSSDPERILQTIRNIGVIVEESKRAEKLVNFISKYRNLIKNRLKDIEDSEKKTVYWEWYKPYKTGAEGSNVHPKITSAGGINICADAKGRYPQVSSEYVWESNPQVIVKQESRGASLDEMKKTHQKVINRESLQETSAVKNSRVYVITWDIFSGLTSVIGDLYFAKWIQPKQFEDINPDQVYSKLLTKFFELENHIPRAYPN